MRILLGVLALAGLLTTESQAAMAPYEFANSDWNAAIRAYKADNGDVLDSVRRLRGYSAIVKNVSRAGYIDQPYSADLQTINAILSTIRPKAHLAGSPVLLPIDAKRLVGDMILSGQFGNKDRTRSYFGSLGSLSFLPGPYGYRAYFRLMKTSTVMVSGSSVFYKLPRGAAEELPELHSCGYIVAKARSAGDGAAGDNKFYNEFLAEYGERLELKDEKFFNSREAAIPCLFAGSLIEVHILCDAEGDKDCWVRKVARSIMSMLAFVGGSPRSKGNPRVNDPLRAMDDSLASLQSDSANAGKVKLPDYGRPGDLVARSGVGGEKGSQDFNIYGQILFPTDLSAIAQTVIFRADQSCGPHTDLGSFCEHNGVRTPKAQVDRWRDNFCEDRDANRLYTCPAGNGHAGQDIWGKDWNKNPRNHPLWAVVTGVAFRRFPSQPAVTVSDVYGSNIDYIYRHMRPSDLERNGIRRWKDVKQGCILAFADRLGKKVGHTTKLRDGNSSYEPTTRHLHFEIRVPTISGFRYVSPYWTLVQSHKFRVTKVDTPPSNRSCR
jgi:hypothetical protein